MGLSPSLFPVNLVSAARNGTGDVQRWDVNIAHFVEILGEKCEPKLGTFGGGTNANQKFGHLGFEGHF